MCVGGIPTQLMLTALSGQSLIWKTPHEPNSAAGSADPKHNCSTSAPRANSLPPQWKVFFSRRVFSLLPLHRFPGSLSFSPCDTQHAHTYFPNLPPNPLSHTWRRCQARRPPRRPLPSSLLPHQLPSLLWLPATAFLWAEVLQQQPHAGERQLSAPDKGRHRLQCLPRHSAV